MLTLTQLEHPVIEGPLLRRRFSLNIQGQTILLHTGELAELFYQSRNLMVDLTHENLKGTLTKAEILKNL